MLTVEDHTVCGGFGSAVLEAAQELSLPTQQVKLVGMPKDHFVAQGARAEQLAEVGLDAVGLVRSLTELIDASSPPARRSQERWTSPITS